MTSEEGALAACVVFSGLWAGLTAMLTLVMHPMLKAMSGRDFALFLRAFLPTARHAPFNYIAIFGMIAAPVVALIVLGGDASGTPFVLTAIGLALTVAGPLLVSSRLAEPNSTAYDTSKGAVEMMVKTLTVALAPKNIRVNGLAPGLVKTPQTSWIDTRPESARWIAHHTPNGQIPGADVCGPGAVYLVSDEAEHVHGHMLLIDGGMSAWQHPARGPYT